MFEDCKDTTMFEKVHLLANVCIDYIQTSILTKIHMFVCLFVFFKYVWNILPLLDSVLDSDTFDVCILGLTVTVLSSWLSAETESRWEEKIFRTCLITFLVCLKIARTAQCLKNKKKSSTFAYTCMYVKYFTSLKFCTRQWHFRCLHPWPNS